MMKIKKYLVPVIIVLGLGVAFVVVNAKADGSVNDLVKRILRVVVVNEEPIEVSVVNQQAGGKVVTFFDNECNLGVGDVSPVIDTNGYSTLVLHYISGGPNYDYYVDCSIDGNNWPHQFEGIGISNNLLPVEIKGQQYRLKMRNVPSTPSECLTVRGYLK